MAILIAALLTFMMTICLCILPFISASAPTYQTKNLTVHTSAFLAVSPDPVGVGQSVQVEMWVEPIHPYPTDTFHGYSVTIVHPDGTVETKGPYNSLAQQATQFFRYTPTSVGNYTFKFTYPGETFTDTNDKYLPATAQNVTLVVQATPVPGYSESPLPTSYWTSPINAQNQNWAPISGNWLFKGGDNGSELGYGDSWGGYNPYTTADTTAHIMWTQQMTTGGLVGGNIIGSYYSGATYYPYLEPPIIIDGLAIYGTQKAEATGEPFASPGTECVNLETGKVLWNNPNITVALGQVWQYTQVPAQYGQGARAYLWGNVTNSDWNVYDVYTGQFVFGYYNAQVQDFGSWYGDEFLAGSDGTIYDYVLDGATASNTTWLAEWNSTLAYVANGISPDTPPTYYNWLLGVQYNVTEPSYLVSGSPLVYGGEVNPGNIILGPQRMAIDDNVLLARVSDGGEHLYYEMGYDITNGQQLWVHGNDEPGALFAPWVFVGDGIYASFNLGNATWIGYNIKTGQVIWDSVPSSGWGDFVQYGPVIADGALYAGTWNGYLTAYNATNGNIMWKFFAGNSGTATPFGSYPMWGSVVVGGGVVYSGGGQESPSNPLYQGYRLFAVNETTGQEIWSISGYFSVKAIADGYLMAFNSYDNTAYTFGQGPSKTTVTAPDVGVTTATPITITGSVTDICTAASNPVVAANFPNGLPCVSDASMSQFMEAVYMQQPMPTNITGVPVTIAVTDKNGNCYDIGTTTTNPTTGFFSLNWTPIIPGNFTVTATFAGTQAYYGSIAQTAFYASSPAPTAAPTATPVTGLATMSALTYGIVAVIIVIIIAIAIVGLLLMRKKP